MRQRRGQTLGEGEAEGLWERRNREEPKAATAPVLSPEGMLGAQRGRVALLPELLLMLFPC